MILEFKLNNFLSFKTEQNLSFEASADKYLHDYHCIDIDNDNKALRVSVIYGANASGKSNLVAALDYLRKICINTKERNQPTGFVSFCFDEKTKNEPGHFEVTFYTNKYKFVYSVVLNNLYIIEEKLIYYPGTQPALIFHRLFENDDEYVLKTGSKIKLNPVEISVLKSNTLNNMTIIAGYSKTNIKFPELELAYNWFNHTLTGLIRPSDDIFRDTILKLYEQEMQFKDFIIKGLEIADFNITDFFIEPSFPIIKNEGHNNIVSDYNSALYFNKSKVNFVHQTKIDNNIVYEKLDARFQSSGTLKYFGLLGLIKQAIDNNLILNFDELENSIHPELFNHMINLFLYHSKLSGSQSQIIFTTHHVDFLDSDFIRKDIVWFAEKQRDGSSNIYSLSDFDIRKNLSFVNAYKAGKFGALPNIGII
jgi:AAA15 family ATPase/GTPase